MTEHTVHVDGLLKVFDALRRGDETTTFEPVPQPEI